MGAKPEGTPPSGKLFRTKIRDFLGVFHLIVYWGLLLWGKWEEGGQLGPSREAAWGLRGSSPEQEREGEVEVRRPSPPCLAWEEAPG